MFSKSVQTLSRLAILTILLTACGGEAEPTEDGPELGSVQEAFTGNWNYSWGDTKMSSADIGTSVGRTCFLTGIGGHFRPIGAYPYSGGTVPAMAGVRKNASGNYEIYVQPDPGKHLIAFARCVNTAAGRIEASSSTGEQSYAGDKVLGAADGSRVCFLQDVKNFAVAHKDNTGAIDSYSWAFDDKSHPDQVQVVNDGTYWKLSIKPTSSSYPVNIHASAVCVNSSWVSSVLSGTAPDPGSKTVNLTSVSGATCGLTGINGHFDAAFGDWDDSVNISTVGSQFKLNLANGKRGWAACTY
jgi:hypothetical protein